jgi:hypothetical protein
MKRCLRFAVAVVFFPFCLPVFAQQPATASGSVDDSAPSLSMAAEEHTAPLLRFGTEEQVSSPPQLPEAQRPYGWHIGIYPVLAWAPVFGAGITLPPQPSNPIESPSGSTSGSLNGAYFGGARFEKGKWSADLLFMWAALNAERTTPHTKVNLDFVFGDATVGREVLLPGLYVEGGFRRLALDIHATVDSDSASRSPGFWDPLIGMTYRRELGKKWRILVHGDGGGFGVGSDVDVTGTGRAEWQFARHYGLSMGYGGMHFSDTDTHQGTTLKISPTLHGPIFGFGFFF